MAARQANSNGEDLPREDIKDEVKSRTTPPGVRSELATYTNASCSRRCSCLPRPRVATAASIGWCWCRRRKCSTHNTPSVRSSGSVKRTPRTACSACSSHSVAGHQTSCKGQQCPRSCCFAIMDTMAAHPVATPVGPSLEFFWCREHRMSLPRVQRPVGVVPSGSPRHVTIVSGVQDACHHHRWAKLRETLPDPQLVDVHRCRDQGRLRSLGVDEVAVECGHGEHKAN
jgi:hypothetical protein